MIAQLSVAYFMTGVNPFKFLDWAVDTAFMDTFPSLGRFNITAKLTVGYFLWGNDPYNQFKSVATPFAHDVRRDIVDGNMKRKLVNYL